MDPGEIVFSAAVAAVSGGLVGGIIGEWRARAAEGRAAKRERAITFRDQQLRAIEETRLDYAEANDRALSLAAGQSESARATTKYYPNAQIWLIGDPALLLETMLVRKELMARNGSGITEDDSRRLGVLLGRVNTALSRQEDRVREDKPPLYPTPEQVESILRQTSEAHGIDPKIVNDILGKRTRPGG
jgi:hypothetical protein